MADFKKTTCRIQMCEASVVFNAKIFSALPSMNTDIKEDGATVLQIGCLLST